MSIVKQDYGELSGGGVEPYPLIKDGISPNNNRCTFENGGYYIKNGYCWFNIIIKSLYNSGGNNAYIKSIPPVSSGAYLSSNNGSSWRAEEESGNYYITSKDTIPKNGDVIQIAGGYKTSANDTV